MDEMSVVIHAHQIDADAVIEEQRKLGYVLLERTPPTIIAQNGFERFVFIPKEMADLMAATEVPVEESRFCRIKNRVVSFLARPSTAD